MDYDAIVIGAGPAGWAAALQGSKIGLNVAIVEPNVLPGGASILGPTKIRVANPNGEHILTTDQIFVATGSRPRRPDSIPFDDRVVCDSDSILKLDAIPRSLAVIGGGVIGCKYACMFATLGVKVTLLDRRHGLMRFLDQAMMDALYHHMREMGIHLMLGEEIENIAIESGRRRNLAVIQVQNGRRVKADRLLAATGRESNTGALGLECVGIETDQTGLVKVNDMFATCTATIHAVGDVIGFPALAGTSMHQGRMAMLHAFGQPTPPSRDLPLAVYTIPEISMVGKTEENCRELGISFEVGVARFAESARGQINGIRDGMLKIVFRREDHVLLGVHMIGANASELVHIGMTMVHAGGTVDQLADTVFNYPTLSEAYRVAALDGLNRL